MSETEISGIFFYIYVMNSTVNFLEQLARGFDVCGYSCKDIFSPCKKVGFGISGGADSMALLYSSILLRKELFGENGAHFVVVSVNHNIRPREESLGDCLFVQEFCNKFSHVEFILEELEPGTVEKLAQQRGRGIEDAARFLRYKFFQTVIHEKKCDYFCLAHNQNDQLETLLLRFLQGSVDGLAQGIPSVRDVFLRPLLQVSRKDIESFLSQEEIDFRYDKTNRENEYLRNRCRNLLIPLLDKDFPGWDRGVLAGSIKKRWDNEFMDSVLPKNFWQRNTDGALSASLKDFFALHPALRRRILFLGFNLLGIDDRVPFHLLEPLMASKTGVQKGRVFSFKDIELIVQNETLIMRKIVHEIHEAGFSLLVESAGTYEICNKKITFLSVADTASSSEETILTFQGKQFHAPFIIRSPLPGDKVFYSGKNYNVQDMLKNQLRKKGDCAVVIEEIGNPFVSIIVLS